MDSLKKWVLSVTVLIFSVLIITHISWAETNFSGGLHFTTGFPQGEMKDQIDRNAYGIDGLFLFSPERSPLAIGFDVSWMNYGSETRREPFSTTIPDVTVDVTTRNNIVQGFLVLRARIPGGPIQLYGDGIVGFNYLYTETKITDTDDLFEDVASTTNQDDVAFAYGFGGGAMVRLYSRDTNSKTRKSPLQVFIDGGVRYILGDEAEYLKEGSIRREDGNVKFDTIKSKTDLLRMHIGVVVRF